MRSDVHVWTQLPLSSIMWMQHREEAMTDASDLLVLVERRQRFLGFIKKRVGDADAEDLYQSALLRAAERIHTLRDKERLAAWFYRLLRNAIVDHLEDRARQVVKLESVEVEDVPATERLCGCSLNVLARLRPEYADIVRRVDVDEESLAVVATKLGITTGNAKVRVHRARRALKRGLWALCKTDSVRACVDCCCD